MRLKPKLAILVLLAVTTSAVAVAQNGFLARHRARVAATQVNQPHWATPLITTNARVEQGLREDFIRQTTPNGQRIWNYGTTRGLQLVPFARTELRLSPPPYFTHSDPRLRDGFGDVAFRLKYRLYGSNEEHHNAIVSATLSASLPTGKQANGSCCAIVTPTLAVGKGFGHLALTTTLGGTLPVSNTRGAGRTIVWNNAVQFQVTHLVWVETEFNSTYFKGARNDGKQQTFTTPGIIVSRIPLIRAPAGRPSPLTLTLAAGEQIALSRFHTYDHSPIFSGRLRF